MVMPPIYNGITLYPFTLSAGVVGRRGEGGKPPPTLWASSPLPSPTHPELAEGEDPFYLFYPFTLLRRNLALPDCVFEKY